MTLNHPTHVPEPAGGERMTPITKDQLLGEYQLLIEELSAWDGRAHALWPDKAKLENELEELLTRGERLNRQTTRLKIEALQK